MANGDSWAILEALKDDLQSYLETNATNGESFLIEIADKADTDLIPESGKKRIKDFRIGLYEISPSDLTRVGAGKTIDFDAAYEISIFKSVTKDGQYDENLERRLMNVKDLVFDWINQTSDSGGTNLNSITGGRLLQLKFNNLDTPIREPRYASVRLQMAGFRNEL
jgi:hypothetical protein